MVKADKVEANKAVIIIGNLLNLGAARPPAAPSVSTGKVLGDRASEALRREGQ